MSQSTLFHLFVVAALLVMDFGIVDASSASLTSTFSASLTSILFGGADHLENTESLVNTKSLIPAHRTGPFDRVLDQGLLLMQELRETGAFREESRSQTPIPDNLSEDFRTNISLNLEGI